MPRLVAWPWDWHIHGPYLLQLEQRRELVEAQRLLELRRVVVVVVVAELLLLPVLELELLPEQLVLRRHRRP